ncbi:universal stress protein [Geodermatophilus sp. SYSU D00703]
MSPSAHRPGPSVAADPPAGGSRFRPVVVGVDGSTAATAAARTAASEAARRLLPVRIVQAVPSRAAVPAGPGLERARAAAVEVLPAGSVTVVVRDGPADLVLADESRRAELVVVGGTAGRLPPGTAALLRRAACPVLVDRTPPAAGAGVVVGVDAGPGTADLLDAAVMAATLRSTGLHVVHTWTRRREVPDASRDPHEAAVGAAERHLVEQYLGPRREGHPGVPVTLDVRHGDPAEALLTVSRTADLLVVGRPPNSPAALTVALAGAAACPVLVVPVPRPRVPSPRRAGTAAAVR